MSIVTLSSDIGQQDFLIGAVKGQLLSYKKDLVIADITHFLAQSNFPEAAYICSNAYKYYPAKTIHLLFIHLFENNNPHVLLVEYNNQYIICPDNGIVTMLLNGKPKKCIAIPIQNAGNFLNVTQTIAESVAAIAKGADIQTLGKRITDIVEKIPLQPIIEEDCLRGHIIFIDNFENIVVNITQPIFEQARKQRKFKIVFKRNEVITQLSNNYFDAPEGETIAWFNSTGYLELAINRGNMAGLFGLQGFNEIMYKEGRSMQNKWFYQMVTIFFE